MAAKKKAKSKNGAKGAKRAKSAKPARHPAMAKKGAKPSAKAAAKPAAKAAAAAPAHNPWKAYADSLAREAAVTMKVMRAFPADQGAFQPHPRSSNAMRLFWTFAIEQGMAGKAIDGTLTMPPQFPPPPATLSECVNVFEKNVSSVVAAAKSAHPSAYSRAVPFFGGPGQISNVPAGMVAEMMLADQIHHRGQLSVYLRMAGGKVPSIYGPSADEPW